MSEPDSEAHRSRKTLSKMSQPIAQGHRSHKSNSDHPLLLPLREKYTEPRPQSQDPNCASPTMESHATSTPSEMDAETEMESSDSLTHTPPIPYRNASSTPTLFTSQQHRPDPQEQTWVTESQTRMTSSRTLVGTEREFPDPFNSASPITLVRDQEQNTSPHIQRHPTKHPNAFNQDYPTTLSQGRETGASHDLQHYPITFPDPFTCSPNYQSQTPQLPYQLSTPTLNLFTSHHDLPLLDSQHQIHATESESETQTPTPPSTSTSTSSSSSSSKTLSKVAVSLSTPPRNREREREANPSPESFVSKASSPPLFKPEFVGEWIDLLIRDGFLNGSFTEAVLETTFADRSADIFASWIGSKADNQEARARGRIVGSALFDASLKKNVDIAALHRHLELIAETYDKMIEKEERKGSGFREKDGTIGVRMVVNWCWFLLGGMCTQINEEMTGIEERKQKHHGNVIKGIMAARIRNANKVWENEH